MAFLKVCAIGLMIAAPVGPIGVLCIRRSLANGARAGFLTGLGAATADATYGAIAAFGLTAISGALLQHQQWLRLIGGLFLFYLGSKTYLSKPSEKPATPASDAGAFTSTLFLTLTNPMTIFSFLGIFIGFGITERAEFHKASLVTLGVFLGSAAWWLFLSLATAYFRMLVTPRWMRNINRASGLIIIAFAVAALWGLRSGA
jgi:threonine/homoserine/homoserine lactone efflux protein